MRIYDRDCRGACRLHVFEKERNVYVYALMSGRKAA